VAKVWIMPGIGQFIINKISAIKYLQFDILKLNKAIIPIKKLGLDKYFNIVVKVKGGGLRGQSEAIQLGVTRALCLNNNEYRNKL
jgi:small subunit ribosomal protein S9